MGNVSERRLELTGVLPTSLPVAATAFAFRPFRILTPTLLK